MDAYEYDRDCGEYKITTTDWLVCVIIVVALAVLRSIGAIKQ